MDYGEVLTDEQDLELLGRAIIDRYKDNPENPRMIAELKQLLQRKPKQGAHVMTNAWESLGAVFYPVPAYEAGKVFKAWEDGNYRVLSDGLIALGAEANTGKTSVMCALGIGLLGSNPDMCALIYALDDGAVMVTRRIIGQIIGEHVQFSNQPPRDALDRTKGAQDILQRTFVRDALDLATMRNDIEAAKEATGCERIYIGIDYLQIIPVGADYQGGKREGYNEALKAIKDLQKELAPQGCIVMLLSQLNRDKENGAHMARFRETSEIENQADIGLIMQGDPNNDESPDRWIKIIKNKRGKRGRWWKTELEEGNNLAILEASNGPPQAQGGGSIPRSSKGKRGPQVDVQEMVANNEKRKNEKPTRKDF